MIAVPLLAMLCAEPTMRAPLTGFVEAIQELPLLENSWATSVVPWFVSWKIEITVSYFNEIERKKEQYNLVVYGATSLRVGMKVTFDPHACGGGKLDLTG